MLTDDLKYLLDAYPAKPVEIRHDLTTSQKFRFEPLRVEYDSENDVVVIVTNGYIKESNGPKT